MCFFELCSEPHSNQLTVLESEVCTEITLKSSYVLKRKATKTELMNRTELSGKNRERREKDLATDLGWKGLTKIRLLTYWILLLAIIRTVRDQVF